LLTLRLRGHINEATFVERKREIEERTLGLADKLAQPETRPEELLGRLEAALNFTVSAPAALGRGTAVQRRQIVQAVLSNPKVDGRKLLYLAKEPFSFLPPRPR